MPVNRNTERASTLAKRIVIVDDHPMIRERISLLLSQESDLTVCGEATDAREAMTVVAATSPDLVIVDFVMPEMSGADVANRIRAKHPQQPILFVSGYSETDAVKRTAPDAPLLTKPFRADALHNAVRGALGAQG